MVKEIADHFCRRSIAGSEGITNIKDLFQRDRLAIVIRGAKPRAGNVAKRAKTNTMGPQICTNFSTPFYQTKPGGYDAY